MFFLNTTHFRCIFHFGNNLMFKRTRWHTGPVWYIDNTTRHVFVLRTWNMYVHSGYLGRIIYQTCLTLAICFSLLCSTCIWAFIMAERPLSSSSLFLVADKAASASSFCLRAICRKETHQINDKKLSKRINFWIRENHDDK